MDLAISNHLIYKEALLAGIHRINFVEEMGLSWSNKVGRIWVMLRREKLFTATGTALKRV